MRARIAAVLAIGTLAACTPSEPGAPDPSLVGVKLGMAPRDVRERFVPGAEGTWQTTVGSAADDTAIEWVGKPGSRVEKATFEFHLGMLVAVRETTKGGGGTERVSATPKTVTLTRAKGDETEVTILSRDCPTHHAEAENLAKLARP